MINKYIFDYRLVLKEDPSFKKFVNINIEKNPTEQHDEEYPYQPFGRPATPETNNETENEIIEFAHDKESVSSDYLRRDLRPFNIDSWADAQEEASINKVELKQEYINPPNPNYNSSVLQLPPPNRFLLPESEAWQGEYTLYKFNNSHVFDANDFICIMNKYRFSQIDHFIRLQHAVYRFDRKRITQKLNNYIRLEK
jgi:hypothetical protein